MFEGARIILDYLINRFLLRDYISRRCALSREDGVGDVFLGARDGTVLVPTSSPLFAVSSFLLPISPVVLSIRPRLITPTVTLMYRRANCFPTNNVSRMWQRAFPALLCTTPASIISASHSI